MGRADGSFKRNLHVFNRRLAYLVVANMPRADGTRFRLNHFRLVKTRRYSMGRAEGFFKRNLHIFNRRLAYLVVANMPRADGTRFRLNHFRRVKTRRYSMGRAEGSLILDDKTKILAGSNRNIA